MDVVYTRLSFALEEAQVLARVPTADARLPFAHLLIPGDPLETRRPVSSLRGGSQDAALYWHKS